jgi:hypothetical protein
VNGPDPQVYVRHTDAFYVLAGELELGLGPDVEWFTAAPGTLAAAPPKVISLVETELAAGSRNLVGTATGASSTAPTWSCLTVSGIATLGLLRAAYERRRTSHVRERERAGQTDS